MQNNNRVKMIEKQEAISRLEAMDINIADAQEIHRLLNVIFSNLRVATIVANENWILYRGIKYDSKPNFFDDIIYPPVSKAKANRASITGESMFYCATQKKAVFYELEDVKQGDKILIGNWVCSAPLLLNHLGFTDEVFQGINADEDNPLNNFKSSEVDSESQFIHNYLSRKFCAKIVNNNMYKLTSAIAKFFLGDIYGNNIVNFSTFDGLFYPTIRLNANAMNIALKPYCITQGKVMFEKAEYIEILGNNQGVYEYKILDIAFRCKDSLIIWENLEHTWTLNDNSRDIYFVDGRAYDETGEIIAHD